MANDGMVGMDRFGGLQRKNRNRLLSTGHSSYRRQSYEL